MNIQKFEKYNPNVIQDSIFDKYFNLQTDLNILEEELKNKISEWINFQLQYDNSYSSKIKNNVSKNDIKIDKCGNVENPLQLSIYCSRGSYINLYIPLNDYNDLLKFIKNPELYKKIKKYNI
ncbi:hypothetical protein M0Q97_00975 [Candidatus Dojkabacteria bacterium]|jgi:hypothetical protein|nr:hypothetical protein [Candidatus Dojkabacteria bacterium]